MDLLFGFDNGNYISSMFIAFSFVPMTHAVDLMQGTFAGDSLNLYGTELLILGSLTVLCTAVGAVLYRKKDWT